MMTLGLIGRGMVGTALEDCLSLTHRIISYDIKDPVDNRETMYKECSAIFVCVPTPTLDSGEQLLSHLTFALGHMEKNGYRGDVIVKSTILPGTLRRMAKEFPKLKALYHNPEFLRERTAASDFRLQKGVIFGYLGEDTAALQETIDLAHHIYFQWSPGIGIVAVPAEAAELAKYMHNTYLAMKVAIFNEFYDVGRALGGDMFELARGAILSCTETIGSNHTFVPGPDGSRGFGGACFPKDTKAFNQLAKDLKAPLSILEASIKYNDSIRG